MQAPPSELTTNSANVSYHSFFVLALAFFGLMLSPGPIFYGSWGVFTQSFEAEFGWSRGSVMATMSCMTAGMVLAAPLAGIVIDRIGTQRVLLVSTLLLAIGLGVLSLEFTSLYVLYIVSFLIGFFTIGTQSISYTRLLSNWFTESYGSAVGFAAAGFGAGYMFMAPLVARFIESGGRPQAFLVLAALVLAVLVFMVFVFFAIQSAPRQQRATDTPEPWQGLSLSQAAQTREFWLSLAVIGIFSFLLTGLIPHIVLIGKAAGVTAGQAGNLMVAFGLTTIVVRIIVGLLLDRIFAPYVAMVCFALSAIGLAVFSSSHHYGVLIVSAILVGVGFGAESDLIPYLTRRYFGLKAFGRIYGCILSVFIFGAGLGPWVIGEAYDYFGNYQNALYMLTVISIVTILLLLLMRPYPQQGSER